MHDEPDTSLRITAARERFVELFDAQPTHAAAAPGRVNLIGEHTDYNDGLVMPMAIERQTLVLARPTDRAEARVYSTLLPDAGVVRFDLGHALARCDDAAADAWTNYMRGIVAGFQQAGITVPGFDAVVDSTVPLGSGLSSSAAIEVATATCLEAMTGHAFDREDKALLCQRAEHEYAGTPCGIMDMFISVFAEAGRAILLDCRSRQVTPVPLDDPAVTVLVCNTNVKHALVGGEYAQRRAQCEAAAKALGVSALRDATVDMLHDAGDRLDAATRRRAHHVVTEIERVRGFAAAVRERDWRAAGALMYDSHASLRDDFQVSCDELDAAVDAARAVGVEGGVYGSRMTGGGFGGCAVSLIRADRAEPIIAAVAQRYRHATDVNATLFTTRPAQGARVVGL